jgi:nitroreductase
MQKPADTNFPIHGVIANRWSPRAFRADPVSTEQLGALFEAARWGASCCNAQPWHYLAATSSDTSVVGSRRASSASTRCSVASPS